MDLEEEKQRHAQDAAEGDDVTYMLEKERERLTQQVCLLTRWLGRGMINSSITLGTCLEWVRRLAACVAVWCPYNKRICLEWYCCVLLQNCIFGLKVEEKNNPLEVPHPIHTQWKR